MKLKQSPEDFKVREIPDLSLASNGNYLVCRLKKKQLNTEEAVQKVAKELGIARSNVGYSGAKDRNAITEQYISIAGASKEEIQSVNIENLELEYVGRSNNPISLGDHLGNEFEIIVRECKAKPKQLDRILNLFGQQRFSHNNEEVGKAIVEKDFEQACELIQESGGSNAAKIRNHLERNQNDYVGAIKKLPSKIASLYVHAYQSHLWNRVARQLAKENKIPILGYGTSFKNKEVKNIYEEILEKEGIKKKDFAIRQYTKISAEGDQREQYVNLESLEIEEIDKNTYKVSFSLPKGSYATVAINQLFQR